MATRQKHKRRSMAREKGNYIPFNMFINNAYKKAQARQLVLQSRISLNDE